jgi:hypothetical protein
MEEDISGYSPIKGPRVIKKHKESDFTNPESSWFKLSFGFGAVAALPAWQLATHTYPMITQLELATVSLSGLTFWLRYCGMDPKKADRSWSKFWFWVDEKLDRHTFNRLTTGYSFLERLLHRKLSIVYPMVSIYPGGIVKFDDNECVVYADLNPQRPSDDDRKLHRMYMKGVVDGMYENQMLKFISSSKKHPRKRVIEYIMKLAEKPGTKQRAEHLTSILQSLIADPVQEKVARQYVMIEIGRHETYGSMIIAKNSMVEDVMLNLKRAKLRPALITDETKIKKLIKEANGETAVL